MRSPARLCTLLLLVAVAARVGAGLWLGLDGPPRGDERGYALLAESLAAGEGLRLPVPADVATAAGLDEAPVLRAFRVPLVPLSLAPVVAAGGGIVALRLLSLLIGALCVPLLFVAARPLTGDRVAAWAACGYALWPPHVFVSVHALSEPLSMALLLVATGLALGARIDGSGRAAGAAGLVAGLAVLARPAALLPAALLGAAAGDRRRAALLLVGLLACLAPWVVRNHLLLGRPLVTTNSGVTLVGGTSAAAAAAPAPGKWLPPGEVYAGSPDAPDLGMWGWSQLGEEASDRRFTRDAVRWSLAHPGGAVRLAAWKLVRLFDPDPRSRKPDAARKALLGWLTLPPLLLLALVGLWTLRGRASAWAPWGALVAGTVLTALVFYGDTRMRTCADPTLLLLAAVGARRLLPRAGPPSSTADADSG